MGTGSIDVLNIPRDASLINVKFLACEIETLSQITY